MIDQLGDPGIYEEKYKQTSNDFNKPGMYNGSIHSAIQRHYKDDVYSNSLFTKVVCGNV